MFHDVKTDHITITEELKKTYTTSFTPNLFHSSQDQTTTLKHKLQVLTLLASKAVTVESISEQTNFWMFGRASDDDIVLDNLGVDQERMLK